MDNGEQFRRNLQERIRSRALGGMKDPERFQGMVPGAILLAIGAIFLLNNFGIVNAHRIWQFWPLILIFAGLVKIFDPCRRVWGAIIAGFGVVLLLNQLGLMRFSWEAFWPLILITVGAIAMWNALQARKLTDAIRTGSTDPRMALNESAIFGGIEKRLNTKEFRGGQLQSMFGGIEIDLRDADIDGNEAILHANAVFGGIEIRVPETWFVASRGHGIFGGYTDSTRYNPPVDPDKPKKTLIILGMAVFGGVEIRN